MGRADTDTPTRQGSRAAICPDGASGVPLKVVSSEVGLLTTIVITVAVPLAFVRPSEESALLSIFWILAKVGSLAGGVLLIWQFFLGFRGAVARVLPDLAWTVDLHKKLGTFGVPLVVLHPVFIGLYYAVSQGFNVFAVSFRTGFSRAVMLGMGLLAAIAFIVISSVFSRAKMRFSRWLSTHLSSYVVPPLLFTHSFLLGSTIQGTPLRYLWWTLTALAIGLYLYRIVHRLGLTSRRYAVTEARQVADKTTEITMRPTGRAISPAIGQSVYLRRSLRERAHPYTVSFYDHDNHELGIAAKEEGPQTAALQRAQPGDTMILDGPFGLFTRVALSRDMPIVMIAGGIGITPFRRLWELLEEEKDRESWLFYGNEFYGDIAYRDEMDALQSVNVVHVLNQEPDFPGEQGFVTIDTLSGNLPRALDEYQYLICGPPVMIKKLEEALTREHVPDRQVRHELFAM